MKLKKLFWWLYKPTDEREQVLYAKAYQRSLNTLAGLVGFLSTFLLLQPWQYVFSIIPWFKFLFYPRVLALVLFTMVGSSFLLGATRLRGEDLVQTVPEKSAAINYMSTITVLVILSFVFQLFTPDYHWLTEWPF